MAETESIDGLSENDEEEIDDAIDDITSDEEGEQENDELDDEQSVNESDDDDESIIEKDKLPEIDDEVKLPDLLSGSDSNFIFDDDDEEDVEAGDSDTETVDEEDDELSLEKIDFNLKESFLTNYHPEKLYHNYDEVYNLSKVVRNKNNEIIDELHRTIPFLTKYEKSKILGMRANQINNGGKPFIKLDSNIIDGYVIAQMELEQKKIPFIIRRPMPNGGCEYWKLADLEIFE
tara:strand:- start:150 stop:848 length:699 start_codon:yes stop_codon:yes gene_type:complete